MGIFNPVHALVVPSLFLATLPLAILAGITTTLAFSVLVFRVLIVYIEMVLSLVPQSTSRSSFPQRIPVSSPPPALLSPPRHQQRHHRRCRRTSGSAVSARSASSFSERGLGIIPSVGAERDFEGVGGWRVGSDDDEVWTMVNPRLDMPERPYGRQHTSPTTPGEGGCLMMKGRTRSPETGGTARVSASPNSSRARTPTGPRIHFAGMGQPDGYFSLSWSPSHKPTKRLPGSTVE